MSQNSMSTFSNFKGNDHPISKLTKWLNEWFSDTVCMAGLEDGQESKIPQYAICYGLEGNGKTSLAKAAGNTYKVPIQEITPFDIASKEDLNNIKKELGCTALGYETDFKIVLIDDLDHFSSSYKKQLYTIHKLSVFPVIYTVEDLYPLPQSFKNNGLRIKLSRPSNRELKDLLKEKLNELDLDVSDIMLEQITTKSISVRSAINSLYNSTINDLFNPNPSIHERTQSVKDRKLQFDFSLDLLYSVINSTDDKILLTALSKMELEMIRWQVKHVGDYEIDKFRINNSKLKWQRLNVSYKYPSFLRNYRVKKPSEEILYLSSQVHVSVRKFREEYRHLIPEDDKPKPKAEEYIYKSRKAKPKVNKAPDTSVASLEDYF